ncbi:DEAD/DEAH box helicase family protein [Sphingobium sp. V4]|uniref:DEAD/DEAH box helicase n=1 Tax=Sphingobium sp. V4 TaxID=3038927 RepID=UPI00255821B9|nr:DEAD/DEAH box helicase family protein [Sphingobium sp. V4]WIW88083.1 DEAD/DEAH box helicase family protein [Sphingobium sp. V4]
MSYFEVNYSKLSYPISSQDDNIDGFRDAQRGALFAVGSHFTSRSEPAIVTMPTGSGKTAVLQACAFLLRAKRVLILTPSRLVREQIAEDFTVLGVLKRVAALPKDLEPPKVMSTAHRVTDPAGWEVMRDFDVVVATVPSVSSHLDGIPKPPSDLFDLILVDEAHHSPAITWQMLLADFPDARRVLFTATPFRRDDREIKARFVYTYDLRSAYRDRVFGHIDYQPVAVTSRGSDRQRMEDVAIAQAAEIKFRADAKAGLDHLLMVRTDSRKRAKELEEIYAAETRLRLKLVYGAQSLSTVKKTLASLEAGHLDGIICVNMLGEGFDMPRLKIAAVHAPHRSLAVTLQFIGRFARTSGSKLGDATFIAPQSAIQLEAERLYTAGAVWAEIVPNLSEARIRREVEARETLDTFDFQAATIPDLSDLSLYSLTPYLHVKVFRLRDGFDITAAPDFGYDREIVFGRVSRQTSSSVFVTRRAGRVAWSADDRLIDVEFNIFIFYYDAKSKLLFVCASKRSDGLYQRVVRSMVGYDPNILPFEVLNRALKGLEGAKFFNVGMRNRQQSSTTESYRMITGPRADGAIKPGDARLYHRGHVFGTATEDGASITIGLSSASKIWSNRSLRLFELLEWCGKVARKLHDRKPAVTGSKVDLLQTGKSVSSIPAPVMVADWEDRSFYIDPPMLAYMGSSGRRQDPINDISLVVEDSDDKRVSLLLEGAELKTRINFEIGRSPLFAYYDKSQPRAEIVRARSNEDLVDLLNDNPLHFMLVNGSRLTGTTLYSAPAEGFEPFDVSLIEAIDWEADGVDVQIEFADGPALDSSIQGYLARTLKSAEHEVVYWDHGSGETADFVTFSRSSDGSTALVRFYHCKGSGGSAPGNRVGDVYEVCGQAVKGLIWCDMPRLVARLQQRFSAGTGQAQFIKGDASELAGFAAANPVTFEIIVVQPGIANAKPAQKIAEVLAAANSYLVDAGHAELRIWGSESAKKSR